MQAVGESSRLARLGVPSAVFATASAALWLLRPLVISGDGVGYIKRLVTPARDIVPGHLVYIPLLEQLRRILAPHGGHGAAALVATAFSSLAGGLACALLFVLARRMTGKVWPGLLAAVGLAVSYGFYRASGDVEAYAACVALLTLSATILLPVDGRRPGWGRSLAAGLVLGLCTLFHTSLVLFTPFVLVAVFHASRSWAKASATVAAGGALSFSAFAAVALGLRGMSASDAVSWVMTSDNGYAQPPTASFEFVVTNLGRVFYGLGRTLVHSPAPDRLGEAAANVLSAVGISFFVLAAIGTALLLRRAAPEARRAIRPLWAWVIPLVLFGFLFWPSATERWVLILPCLWLCAAMAAGAIRRRALAASAAGFLLLVPMGFNLWTVTAERRLDERTLERSRAVSALLHDGDLLLFPGHTWDEYVGFYEDAPVERFILASFAGEERGDREAFLERLESRIEATHRRGRRVVAVRVFDEPDSHHGWSLLRAMGIPRDDVLILLSRYRVRRILSEPVGAWEVLPAGAAEPGSAVAGVP